MQKDKLTESKTEALLDESLDESFPASDPSAVTRAPADKRETQYPPPQTSSKSHEREKKPDQSRDK